MTEAERADYEERAAILEYEAGLPREEAERRAREMVLKIQTQKEIWPTNTPS